MAKRLDARAREIARLYEDAQRRLERLVRDALARGADGTAAFYAGQLRQVRTILAALQQRAVPDAATLVATTYGRAALAVDESLGVAGSIGFGGVHQEAIGVLAANVATRLNDAAELVGRRTDDAFRKAQLHAVAQAVATGEPRTAASAALERKLIRDGTTDALTGFVDSAGKRWPLDVYSRMAVRTATREAMSAGTAARMRDHGSDLVTISDHGATDELCAAYAGNTYSLDGQTEGYDVLDQFPPFHPNCEHVMAPAAGNLDAFIASALD